LHSMLGIEVNELHNETFIRDKQKIREHVWSLLEENRVARFPKPIVGRIPNFEGAEKAAERLKTLSVFQDATVVKVNPDAPQRSVREGVLRQKKTLLVPTPRLRKGFLMMNLRENSMTNVALAATIKGSWRYGKPVDINELPKVDLVVAGSVAVSRKGVRLGKGGGYSEIEYGVLRELGLVDEKTPIATTVHDLQIVDTAPADEHDLSVDVIVTPTQVIDNFTERRRPRGILWDRVTDRMLEEIPVLKALADLKRK